MLITSVDNDKIKGYMKLKEKKYRDKTGLFLVEGEHLVLEAYRAGLIKEILLLEDSVFPIDCDIIYVSNEILNKLSTIETPSYIMAVCYKKSEDFAIGDKVLMLDGVQDPGNLGTIIRSAKAFGVDTILLSNLCADLYNSKVIRATQGMMFHIDIKRCDLISVINDLKKGEIPIYVTRVEYGEDIRYLKDKDKSKYCLVMGNEGNGVSDEIKDLADKFIYIEMNHSVESLNVSIATSILLYELGR